MLRGHDPLYWPGRNCWPAIGCSWDSTRCKKDNINTTYNRLATLLIMREIGFTYFIYEDMLLLKYILSSKVYYRLWFV